MSKITMKANNINLSGIGGAGMPPMDRGADFQSDRETTNPFHRANFFDRWREYTNWYYTSWMARKGVDIPVDDALRGGFDIKHIDPVIARRLKKVFDGLDGLDKIDIACKQERLYGGSGIYMVARDLRAGQKGGLEEAIDIRNIAGNPGAIEALNVADISRISVPHNNTDIFSPDFERPRSYWISGVEVHSSRMIIFDGKPLLGRTSYNVLLPNARINPAGMGESILTTVYDDLLRATGTAQAAFHLVNMASVMLIMMQDFAALNSSKEGNKKLVKMQEICNSINLYKGAILDGLQVDVKNLPASFGSVPELVIAFIQFLSAAWDIPATRFIGQSPSGLNATGDSDLENYYNMVQSFRERRVTPRILQVMKLLAVQEYGIKQGSIIADEMTIEFKNLWNDNPKEEAETAKMWLDGMIPLLDRGSITPEDFALEAKKRNVLLLQDTKIVTGGMEDTLSGKVKDILGGNEDDSGKKQDKADKQVSESGDKR